MKFVTLAAFIFMAASVSFAGPGDIGSAVKIPLARNIKPLDKSLAIGQPGSDERLINLSNQWQYYWDIHEAAIDRQSELLNKYPIDNTDSLGRRGYRYPVFENSSETSEYQNLDAVISVTEKHLNNVFSK